jgi:hypothetical protein
VGEIGKAEKQATRVEKVPVEEPQGADEATLKVEPALADEGVEIALGIGEFGENVEEEVIGEEEGGVGFGEIGGRGLGGLLGGAGWGLELHGEDHMILEGLLGVLEPELRPACGPLLH